MARLHCTSVLVGLAIALVGSTPGVASADITAGKNSWITTSVDQTGPALDSHEFYGQGNGNGGYAEYGLTTFNFTSGDFGGAVSHIASATLTLTVNDRDFSGGDMVQIFFTPDTAAVLGGGFNNLSFAPAFVNGINGSQYVNAPVSLGVFTIPEMFGRAGGLTDLLDLTFSGAAEAALITSINSGTDFQILLAATTATDSITYSGEDNFYDAGDPRLDITVSPIPAPGAALLGIMGLSLVGWLRPRGA